MLSSFDFGFVKFFKDFILKIMSKSKISPKINNFVNESMSDSLKSIVNFMVKYNIISVDLYDIFYRRKNKRKFLFCILNCIYMWICFILIILILKFKQLMNLFDKPMIPFDKLYQIFGITSTALISISIFKTRLLIEEWKNNLSAFAMGYYLLINDKSHHKLNKFNYKKLSKIVKLVNFLLIQMGSRITVLFIAISLLPIAFASKSIILILLGPIILYAIIIFFTSALSYLCITYIVLIYIIMRFKQVNNQIKIYQKLNKISSVIFIRLIQEHNDVTNELNKLNSFSNISVAALFPTTAIAIDLLIYLLLYTTSIYFQLLFVISFVSGLSILLLINVLLIKVSSCAHHSYNVIYSITQRQTLSYKVKLKVFL